MTGSGPRAASTAGRLACETVSSAASGSSLVSHRASGIGSKIGAATVEALMGFGAVRAPDGAATEADASRRAAGTMNSTVAAGARGAGQFGAGRGAGLRAVAEPAGAASSGRVFAGRPQEAEAFHVAHSRRPWQDRLPEFGADHRHRDRTAERQGQLVVLAGIAKIAKAPASATARASLTTWIACHSRSAAVN